MFMYISDKPVFQMGLSWAMPADRAVTSWKKKTFLRLQITTKPALPIEAEKDITLTNCRVRRILAPLCGKTGY
jgi:hypothetical protein